MNSPLGRRPLDPKRSQLPFRQADRRHVPQTKRSQTRPQVSPEPTHDFAVAFKSAMLNDQKKRSQLGMTTAASPSLDWLNGRHGLGTTRAPRPDRDSRVEYGLRPLIPSQNEAKWLFFLDRKVTRRVSFSGVEANTRSSWRSIKFFGVDRLKVQRNRGQPIARRGAIGCPSDPIGSKPNRIYQAK